MLKCFLLLTAWLYILFVCSLTDPLPWDNETIFMDVSVRGTYPGNVFDMTPYIELSDVSDNFTSSDIYEYRRSIRVSLRGKVHMPVLMQSTVVAAQFWYV